MENYSRNQVCWKRGWALLHSIFMPLSEPDSNISWIDSLNRKLNRKAMFWKCHRATFILHCIGKLTYICLCTCNWSKKKVWFLRCSNTSLLNTLNIPVSNKSTTIYTEESMFSNPPCQFSFQKFFPPEAMFIKACLENMLRCVPVLSLV